jgi:hypothetical protein
MKHSKPLAALGAFLLACLLIVLFLRDIPAEVAALYPQIPAGATWFSLPHAATLYLLTPLVTAAAIILLLAPGLLVALAGRQAADPGELLLKGFGIAFTVHFFTGTLLKLGLDRALDSLDFLLALGASLVLAFAWLAVRAQRDDHVFDVLIDPAFRGRYYTLLAIPFLVVIPLLPVLFWQDLNADGFEAMEMGRSLAFTIMPMFPEPAGVMGLGNGKLPMAYPIHWFIMLFGPTEASARLPLVLYVMVVYAALQSCIEYQAPRRMRGTELAVLLLAMACYVVATSFNSGYDNYFSDISSPAAFDTLTILLILGSVYFLWAGNPGWFLFFTIVGFLGRPTLLLIVVLMGIGIQLAAPQRRRTSFMLIGIAVGTWIALLIGYEHVLLPRLSDGLSTPYSSAGIISRYQQLTFTDLHRLLYAAAPTGLLPAFALLAWRRQDAFSRVITVVTAGYFLAFYVPAFVSLHHYVPAMILPLIVLWRLVLHHTVTLRPAALTAVVTAVMLWLSLPQHFGINRLFRDIGTRTAYLIGDYLGDYHGYRSAMQGTSLIENFFPYEWNVPDAAREVVGGYQLVYYAQTSGTPAPGTNYLLLPQDASAPNGFTLLKRDQRGSAWVRDRARWDQDRYHPASTEYRSWLYRISRETSFFFLGTPAHNYDIDLSKVPLLWRIFPEQG